MDVTHPNTGRRTGLSQAKITQAAETLTREHGLGSWSIRDLAQRLEVASSVVYHYFASRDTAVNAIIGQLVDAVPLPDKNLEWKAWFMTLTQNLCPTLLAHPGVTERMVYGNLSAEMLPTPEVSFRKLHRAGLRHYAPQAHTMILNTILWIITARNLRSPTRGEQHHDLNQTVTQIQVLAAKSPTLTEMMQDCFVPLADPQNEGQVSQGYFNLIMESMLAGSETTVLPRETDI